MPQPLMFPRRMGRTFRVGRTGARIYLRYRRTQKRAVGQDPLTSQATWDAAHSRSAEELYQLAINLRGLLVKVGQFAGTRADIVPPQYVASLSRLQDSVPPHPLAEVQRTIRRELGEPEQLFARFDAAPIATASLAQVHRARLHDGREVVVKVQHPEVAGLVPLDLRNVQMILGIVARRRPQFDFRAIVREVGRQVPLELDFVREAEMTRRVAANLASHPGIVLPTVVDEMVTRRVLVLEYLDGERLLAADRSRGAGPALAKTITEAYGHQILVDGLFQADPHPGNVLVLPDGRAALLDFGLTKELPEAARLGFAALVLGVANRDMALVEQGWRGLGLKSQDERPEAMVELLQLIFGPREVAGASATRAALNRNPVEAIPSDLVLLGRVIGLLRGVCASLGSPLTPMAMLQPFAERALASGAATEPARLA